MDVLRIMGILVLVSSWSIAFGQHSPPDDDRRKLQVLLQRYQEVDQFSCDFRMDWYPSPKSLISESTVKGYMKTSRGDFQFRIAHLENILEKGMQLTIDYQSKILLLQAATGVTAGGAQMILFDSLFASIEKLTYDELGSGGVFSLAFFPGQPYSRAILTVDLESSTIRKAELFIREYVEDRFIGDFSSPRLVINYSNINFDKTVKIKAIRDYLFKRQGEFLPRESYRDYQFVNYMD